MTIAFVATSGVAILACTAVVVLAYLLRAACHDLDTLEKENAELRRSEWRKLPLP